jgi:hypothetical protein
MLQEIADNEYFGSEILREDNNHETFHGYIFYAIYLRHQSKHTVTSNHPFF